MIALTGNLTCATLLEAAIVASHLPEHIRLSRAEPGCIKFHVEPTDNPLVWQLDEEFTDQAAFQAHQGRTRASLWWQATGHITRDFVLTGG